MNAGTRAAPWIDAVREQYASQGLGGRLSPQGRPALVVVDLICGFTNPSCPPGMDLDDVVHATAALLEAARTSGALVVFTTIAFTPEEIEEVLWLHKMPALRSLLSGSAWVEVDQRLKPQEGESLVTKRAASAFAGTDLADLLRREDVGTLVVCGATTSGCIRATALDACALGWPTFVPSEAVGDRAAGPHEASLLDIDAKYADVVQLDDAVAILSEGGVRS